MHADIDPAMVDAALKAHEQLLREREAVCRGASAVACWPSGEAAAFATSNAGHCTEPEPELVPTELQNFLGTALKVDDTSTSGNLGTDNFEKAYTRAWDAILPTLAPVDGRTMQPILDEPSGDTRTRLETDSFQDAYIRKWKNIEIAGVGPRRFSAMSSNDTLDAEIYSDTKGDAGSAVSLQIGDRHELDTSAQPMSSARYEAFV